MIHARLSLVLHCVYSYDVVLMRLIFLKKFNKKSVIACICIINTIRVHSSLRGIPSFSLYYVSADLSLSSSRQVEYTLTNTGLVNDNNSNFC